jgi:hypothetical protein
MKKTLMLPDSFEALARLNRQDLQKAHSRGACPEPGKLDGLAEGLILDPAWFEWMRLWRGKVFHSDNNGRAHGQNRLGVGPFEFRRYAFKASKTQSAFSNRKVVLLDHDLPDNPYWVRIFHDELVEMRPGLYLTCSHLRIGGHLQYASYFAFDFGR